MERKTMSVPEAGLHYYELGRNASYSAAARGDIPTIRVGRLLRVPVQAMERMLAETRPANGRPGEPAEREQVLRAGGLRG